MRILVVTSLYPHCFRPHRATFNRQQIRALTDQHAVRVIAPVPWTEELAGRWKSATFGSLARHVVRDGIQVDHPRYVYPPRILRGWYGHCFLRSIQRPFQRAVREFRPEVILGSWAYPDGWAAVRLGHQAGLPVVIKVHGSDVPPINEGDISSSSSSRWLRTVEGLQRADGVVAVSRDLAERVIARGVDASRVNVVFGGVDPALFHLGSAEEARATIGLESARPLVLFIGHWKPCKGVDLLIDACALLRSRSVEFQCCLIGAGPLETKLRSQVVQRRLGDHVKLLGPRPLNILADWYRAAAVLVLPSRSEGVPNVVLEALACGTPVVSTRVGGLPEIGGGDLLRLVRPDRPDELANAIAEVLTRRDRPAGQITLAGWDQSAQNLAAALSKVVRPVEGQVARAPSGCFSPIHQPVRRSA